MNQINSVSLIIDIVALILAILIVAKSASKGFISSIISFLGGLASIIISSFISKPISEYIYHSFLENRIVFSITESIGTASTNNASEFFETLEQSFQSFPTPIISFLQSNSQSVLNIVTNNLGQSAERIAQDLCANIIEPLILALISTLSFIILFVTLSLVFKTLSKVFVGIKKIPIIGKLNSILGAIFGILYSFIVLYFIYVILYFILMAFNPSLQYITQETLDSSYIFRWLSSFRFF